MTAVGHPAIRATHDKTLELTADAAITPRATCVVGVSAVFDSEALAQLRGPVTYEIAAGDRTWAGGAAVVNPGHAVVDRFVIRRSRHADAETLAVAATGAAADLPRELAAALAEPGRPVTFTITERQTPPPLVILAPGEPPGRLGILWRNASAQIDLDAGRPSRGHPPAAAGFSEVEQGVMTGQGGTITVAASSPPGLLGPTAVARLHALTSAGARLACPADPVVGALLAAGLPPAPVLHLGRMAGRQLRQPDLQQLVSLTPCPVVLSAGAEEAEDVARSLRVLVSRRTCWIDDAGLDVGVTLAPFDVVAELPYRWPDGPGEKDADRWFVVGPAPGGGRAVDLDAVVLSLRDAGVPGRQIADALRPLGLRRNEIYRILGDAPAPEGAEP